MTTNLNSWPPDTKKEFYIGPAIRGRPTAPFWRFWIERDELYALNRVPGGEAFKVSVHKSGQIHHHTGERNIQKMVGMQRVDERWQHAIELRFLISEGADRPPARNLVMKKGKTARLVETRLDQILHLNLIVGESGEAAAHYPAQFGGGLFVWMRKFQDGRLAALVARVMPMDELNRSEMMGMRGRVRANYTGGSLEKAQPYMQVAPIHWGPGGNVILVIPLGQESHRFDQDDERLASTSEALPVTASHPDSSFSIYAPDQSLIAMLQISGASSEVKVFRGKEELVNLGTIALTLYPSAIRPGNGFRKPQAEFSCITKFCGLEVRRWEYSVNTRFDGTTLSVQITLAAGQLDNKKLDAPVPGLSDDEEILIRLIPSPIQLEVNSSEPASFVTLACGLRIRPIEGPPAERISVANR